MSKYIGPALPPHLKHLLDDAVESPSPPHETKVEEDVLVLQDSNGSLSDDNSNQSSEADAFGPALPPGFLANQSDGPSTSVTTRVMGPSLPAESSQSTVGPSLPPGFLPNQSAGPSSSSSSSRPLIGPVGPIGPALPPGFSVVANNEDDSDDDDVVGPMPLPDDTEPAGLEYLQKQMERRALKMKRKLRGEDEEDSTVTKRETWMLELPPDRASEFGLGPRQFRAKPKQELGDRTVWTDTPDDKTRKQNTPGEDDTSNVDEMQLKAIYDRDRAMEKYTEKHNKKKRKESLVDMHQKKLKKKRKKEEEERKGKRQERRPFDRDVDLQANRFDEAQKKAILRKAQLLDDRFSRGKSKFL